MRRGKGEVGGWETEGEEAAEPVSDCTCERRRKESDSYIPEGPS